MKLTKHEKVLLFATVLFVILAFFTLTMQDNIINQVGPSESKAVPYLIDINTASSDELVTLDGIGPSLATRIIEYRTKHGGFKNTGELRNVSGIGDSTFKAIKDYIKV